MERLILTGQPGHGKSTLLRQIAVQASAGVHPFGGEDYKPIRTLLLDLENSDRHVQPRMRHLLSLLPEDRRDPDLYVLCRPEGLDLLSGEDEAWLAGWLKAIEPHLLVIGPHYQMSGGNPNDEEPAKVVARLLNHYREAYTLAILMEAHTPHGVDGDVHRPYGASLWKRWPEYGLYLAETGALSPWRGARGDGKYPPALKRGELWPWIVASERPSDAVFERCCKEAALAGRRLGKGALHTITGIPETTIGRSLREHGAEYETFCRDLQPTLGVQGSEGGPEWGGPLCGPPATCGDVRSEGLSTGPTGHHACSEGVRPRGSGIAPL